MQTPYTSTFRSLTQEHEILSEPDLSPRPLFRLSLTLTRRIVRRLIEEEMRVRSPSRQAKISLDILAQNTACENFHCSVRILRRVIRRLIDHDAMHSQV